MTIDCSVSANSHSYALEWQSNSVDTTVIPESCVTSVTGSQPTLQKLFHTGYTHRCKWRFRYPTDDFKTRIDIYPVFSI